MTDDAPTITLWIDPDFLAVNDRDEMRANYQDLCRSQGGDFTEDGFEEYLGHWVDVDVPTSIYEAGPAAVREHLNEEGYELEELD